MPDIFFQSRDKLKYVYGYVSLCHFHRNTTESQAKTISSYCHKQLRATRSFERETCRILKDSSSESRVKDKLNGGRAKEKGKSRAGHKIIRSTREVEMG